MQEDQQVPGEEAPHGSSGAVLKAALQPREARKLEAALERSRLDERAEQEEREELELEQRLDKERRRLQQEERNRVQREADWKRFMQREWREIHLRRDGQLAELLGGPRAGEPAAALRRLAQEDRRQAAQGLVALMSGGELRYKLLDELTPEDMPARLAAERLRTTWLKERGDGWLAHGKDAL